MVSATGFFTTSGPQYGQRKKTSAEGRTAIIFSFKPLCNCPTINSVCCTDQVERKDVLASIFPPLVLFPMNDSGFDRE